MFQGELLNGRYWVSSRLGAGGFGETWQANDTVANRWVAVKFPLGSSPAAADNALREIRNLVRSQHIPEIVDILDSGEHRGRQYIVMEFCDGGSLRNWVANRQPSQTVLAAVFNVAQALSSLHKVGGFHRDVKPDNLLIQLRDGYPFVKLGDLGIARIPEVGTHMTNRPLGTEGYLAPEVRGGGAYAPSADIYSLGVTLVELLTGSRDLGNAVPKIAGPAVKALAALMILTDPRRRPSAGQVRDQLAAILNPARAASRPRVTQPESANNAPLVLGGLLVLGLLAALAANDEA